MFPYVAEVYPQLGITPALVPTIRAERTFWDKVTILHREFHRLKMKHNDELAMDVPNHTPARYSRHYYDL
ncbi:MAG: nucleotidyl transferase AbiEii/AbiGii toxin family protein [Rickettsiales bacterium]|nr:nucleotidyl transferase AbiEii/AbiGii toxin family protein [Rickettsiales bacterium]